MKVASLLLAFCVTTAMATPLVSDTMEDRLNGTWSGSWVPDGVRDAMTIELRHDDAGKLTGRIVTPTPMDFSKATFDGKTHLLSLEAMDGKTGTLYKLNGKVQGTEIKGTVTSGNQTGQIDLIKWTYVPRITRQQ
jgi:hypothetical protein